MSIKEIRDELNGKVFYQVSVSRRSKANPRLRATFKRRAIDLVRAQRIERELIAKATISLIEQESLGKTWGELVEKWELEKRFSKSISPGIQASSVIDNVNALKMYTNTWWQTSAKLVKRSDVKVVFDKMYVEGKSKSRMRNVSAAINGVFKWAIDMGQVDIDRSPAEGFSFKRIEDKRPEILNLNEIRLFLKLAKDQSHPWYQLWVVALLTGMRSGELMALEWKDVDFENKRLTVSKSYNRRSKNIKSTKAGYWRDVPISADLEIILKELKLVSGDRPTVFQKLPRWETGEAATVIAQFCLGNGLPKIKFHTLRACFATQLIKDGIAPAIVMKVCGWRDLKTMQRYVRLAGIEVEGATEGLKLLPDAAVMGRVVQLFT